MKQCSKCKKTKSFEKFYKRSSCKDGYDGMCKECQNKKSREYYKKNQQKLKEYAVEYRKENRDEILIKDRQRHKLKKEEKREYYQENRDDILARRRELYQSNKEKYRESSRRRYQNRKKNNPEGLKKNRDEFYCKNKNKPKYKLLKSIRGSVDRIIKAAKLNKELRSVEYLGCSIQEFQRHIESLWLEGMTWENHGDKWHIDHKIPLDWFVKNSENPWKANHYTNLQPLWAKDNLSKGNKLED